MKIRSGVLITKSHLGLPRLEVEFPTPSGEKVTVVEGFDVIAVLAATKLAHLAGGQDLTSVFLTVGATLEEKFIEMNPIEYDNG